MSARAGWPCCGRCASPNCSGTRYSSKSAYILAPRKHDVEIGVYGQQFGFPFGEPLRTSASLALRTAPVATRVVEDDAMPAIVLPHMATKHRCSAVPNVREGLPLLRGEHVSPVSQKILFVNAENIGQFEPMIAHRSTRNVLAVLTMSSGSNSSRGLVVERTAVSATCK